MTPPYIDHMWFSLKAMLEKRPDLFAEHEGTLLDLIDKGFAENYGEDAEYLLKFLNDKKLVLKSDHAVQLMKKWHSTFCSSNDIPKIIEIERALIRSGVRSFQYNKEGVQFMIDTIRNN